MKLFEPLDARYAFLDDSAFRAKLPPTSDAIVTRLGGRGADDAVAWRGDRIYVIRRTP